MSKKKPSKKGAKFLIRSQTTRIGPGVNTHDLAEDRREAEPALFLVTMSTRTLYLELLVV